MVKKHRLPFFALLGFVCANACAKLVTDPTYLYEGVTPVDLSSNNPSKLKELHIHSPAPNELFSYLKTLKARPKWAEPNINKRPIVVQLKNLKSIRYRPKLKNRTFLESTFLIDHERIHFVEVKRQIDQTYKLRPTPRQLRNFTYQYIKTKIGHRGLTPASFIAKHASGNISAHSVFLVALLRLYRYRSTLVFGHVLKKTKLGPRAYKRNWAIVKWGKRWVRVDAFDEIDRRTSSKILAVIPYATLEDESIDFKLSMLTLKAPNAFFGR